MIHSKSDYLRYIAKDKEALFISKRFPGPMDDIWKYERLLRKTEYFHNCRKDFFGRAIYLILRYIYHRHSVRLGFTIPINVIDEGLSLAHYGNVTINKKCSIGKNCRIYNDVVIGSKGFGGECPSIGDNVFIGTGAKILGDIEVGSNSVIGANTVVTKSVPCGSTVVGAKMLIIETK